MRRPRYLIAAGAVFGLASFVSTGPAVLLVLSGAWLLTAAIWRGGGSETADPLLDRGIFGVTALFAVMAMAGSGSSEVIGSPPEWLFLGSGLVWLALAFGWLLLGSKVAVRRVIYGLALVASLAFGAIHVLSAEGVGFDVAFLHEAAAEAIENGESPYSDAVMFPNGAPGGPEFIVGYPYPPSTAIAYAASEWAFGDPRWTSLIGWLATLAVIGAVSLRRGGSAIPVGVMLMAAAIPTWPLVLTTGWTESFSLALLALAVTIWTRPRASGALSGVFLGSKQYLLAATPLLVTSRVDARWTRAIWASGGMLVSFLPVLIWGVPDFIEAAVRFHLETPPRPDGASLVGLLGLIGVDWSPPLWVMVVVVLAVTVVLGRRVKGVTTWLAALGVILTVALFLSSQAFTNYWFLMAGIAALAASRTRGPEH